MRDREEARKRAEQLVEQMTTDEMAGQLKFDAPAIEHLGIPEYNWWNEGLHGVARAGTATVFPQAIGMAAAWDPELMYLEASVIAEEARAKYNVSVKYGDRDIYKGLTLWSPNVNIFRDPRWGRGHETYGEDPVLTSRLAVPFIKGLQGDGKYLKTAACAKHFAVHSGPEALRHSFNAVANSKDMFETYLPAFEACVKEADVEAVMGAYNRTNGEPCCANEELMKKILREKWGFQGYYVSDCWAIRDFHENHHVTNNGVESSALALNTGCDLNCGCTYLCLKEALRKHLVKKSTLKQAAVRLFTTRYLLGMFDETEYDQIPYSCVESKEHLELAQRAAEESIVLLKNNGILPLRKEEIHVIGVIGPNADNRKSLEGNYHGTASHYITALEGIQDYAGEDIRVMYSKGSHLFMDKEEQLAKEKDRLSEAMAVAEYSDVIGCTYLCLKEALRKHLVKKSTLKQAAVRLFTTRYLLGMFDETEYDQIPYSCVESKEHLELAQRAAEESIVLLKNNGILPLRKEEIHVIGVIGPNADNRKSLEGNYHGTASHYITALEGIQDYAGEDIRVMYSKGSHLFMDKEEQLAKEKDRLSEAMAVAEYSDVIVLCVGLDETLEGEQGDTGNRDASGDKEDLEFPKGQQELMKAVLNTGKPVIVCNFTGSAMNLSLAEEKADAVIQAWYPGARGGRALAKILFGEVSPCGKLPVTFYKSLEQLPAYEDYSMKGRTYRYLTEEPLYPFGYGLTYGDVQVLDAQPTQKPDKDHDMVLLVKVKNNSDRDTKEVVQVYIRNEGTSYAPLHPVLCAFMKIKLDAGEEKTLEILVPSDAYCVINDNGEKIFDSPSSILYIGTSSPDKRSESLSGKKAKEVQIHW